jgi:hypothetical protein
MGSRPNAIIGACNKGQEVFKGGEVWEIQEVLGELILKRVGESHIGNTMEKPGAMACWGHTLGGIFDRCGKFLILTAEELAAFIRSENEVNE